MHSNPSYDVFPLCPWILSFFCISEYLIVGFFCFLLFVKSQILCILLSLPLKQNSYSEGSESWLSLSSDKFKTNLLDRNTFSCATSIFSPVINITERNKLTICWKISLLCRWSCNFYRIWCCFCSGCIRAPVESLYSVPIHVSARDSWGQMVLLWFKYVFIKFHLWALLVVTSAWKLVNFY